jgi:hypothetical protein
MKACYKRRWVIFTFAAVTFCSVTVSQKLAGGGTLTVLDISEWGFGREPRGVTACAIGKGASRVVIGYTDKFGVLGFYYRRW